MLHLTVEPDSIPRSLWLAPQRQRMYDFVPGIAHRAFALGRAALYWLCRYMRWGPGDRFLLPAFVCSSIVRPFVAAGVTPEFYRVRRDLSVDIADIEARLKDRIRGGLVIHYFGWPQPLHVRAWLANRHRGAGVWIEDLAHSLLTVVDGNALGTAADVALSSFRKFIPCPDGAMLSFQRPISEDNNWILRTGWRYRGHGLLRLGVMTLAGMGFDRSASSGRLSANIDLLHRVLKGWRATNPLGTGSITPMSRYLIERFDRMSATKGRRENTLRLATNLRRIPGVQTLFPDPEEGIVPMALPVYVRQSALVKSALAARGIEVQRLWPRPMGLEAGLFPEIEHLQWDLLSFPVAERYGLNDMDATAEAVAESLAN